MAPAVKHPAMVGEGLKAVFEGDLPEGVQFLENRGTLLWLSQTREGLRWIGYLVKIDVPKGGIFYKPLALTMREIAEADNAYERIREAIAEFKEELATDRAAFARDGAPMHLYAQQESQKEIAEALRPVEPAEKDPEKHE